MSLEQLQIKIGAEVSGVISNVAKADNSITRLTHSLDDLQQKLKAKQNLLITEKDISKIHQYQNEIVVLKGRIQEVSKITIGASAVNSLNKIPKASNEAGNSLNNLSRIAQDAPYGFIGISNNVNPMLESFQRLKTQTGSTGAALKAMATGLMGAGGLGLAVGIVSSLLVVFGDKLFKSGSAAESQAEKIKKARQALDDYVDGLNDLDKSRVKGLQTAQEELVNLKTLYTATQNLNIPIAERKKLVDELQSQYPKYFGNIKDEVILLGGAKDAYEKLSTAILASAKARAAEETLVDIEKQALAVNQQISGNAANQIKLQQQLNTLKQKGLTTISATGEERLTTAGARANKIQGQLNGFVSEGNDLLKQRNDLISRANVISSSLSKIVEKTPEALLKPDANLPKIDKPKAEKENKELEKLLQEKKDILLEFIKDFEAIKIPFPELSKSFEDFSATELTSELRDKLTKALISIAPIKYKVPVSVEGFNLKELPPLKMPVDIQFKIDKAAKAEAQIKSIVEGFNQQMNGVVAGALAGFGENLGAAIAGGSFDNVFKGIVASAGDFLQQLGKILIQTAIKMELFKKALYTWAVANPALAIGAGVLLITAGALIKNTVLPKPKGFATGGWVKGQGSGDTVPAMLTPGEFVVTKDKAPFIASLLKMMGSGLKLPKMINSSYHFADGGLVPNVRSANVNKINVAPASMEFPDYLPAVSISYDQFRVIYKRAFKQQNVFGG